MTQLLIDAEYRNFLARVAKLWRGWFGIIEEIPVRFRGRDLIFFRSSKDGNGPLGTREQFDNWETSTAYVKNGKIWKWGKVIGTTEDLEFIEEK